MVCSQKAPYVVDGLRQSSGGAGRLGRALEMYIAGSYMSAGKTKGRNSCRVGRMETMQKYLTEVKFMTLNHLRHPLVPGILSSIVSNSCLDKGAQER